MKSRVARPTLAATSAVALAIVAAGCASGDADRVRGESRDSAGVRLSTYDVSAGAVPEHAVVDPHDLQIGVQDGEPERSFTSIVGLARLPDGSIVVADAGASALRVFDAAGTYVETWGGRGDGPGELASLTSLAGTAGDTVVAWDAGSRRLTAFAPGRGMLGTTTLNDDRAGRALRVLRLDDGSLVTWSRVVTGTFGVTNEPSMDLDSIRIEHLEADGAPLDTIGVVADREWVREVVGSPSTGIALYASERPLGAAAFVATDGTRAVIGRSSTWEIAWHRIDGTIETVVRVEGAQQPATEEILAAHLERRLSELPDDPEAVRRVRALYADYPPVERLPAFERILVDPDGNVWVAGATPLDREPTTWLVFSPEGALLGGVETPPGLDVLEVGRGDLLGVVRDDFDVPYVRRHALRGPSADGAR